MKIKNKKILSKSLAIGLFLSTSITSFAGILSDNGRYETFEGDYITIDDILEEGNIEPDEIQGNTMVNLFDGFSWLVDTENVYSIYSDNKLTYQAKENFTQPISYAYISGLKLKKELLGGKTYTMYFRCNVNDATLGIVGTISEGVPTGSEYKMVTKRGINKFTFTLDEDISLVNRFDFRLYETNTRSPHIFEDFVILEGDVGCEYISYFEGMKSIAEVENNNIKILSDNNGNLLDKNDITEGYYLYRLDGREVKQSNSFYMNKYIEVKEGQVFYSTPTEFTLYIYYDSDKKPLGLADYNTETTVSVVPKNAKFMRLAWFERLDIIDELWVSVRPNCNKDILYNFNSTQILLSEPLRAVGDVKDRIVKRNGQWVIERNCGEILLNGGESETWSINNEKTLTQVFCLDNIDTLNAKNGGEILSSDFATSPHGQNYEDSQFPATYYHPKVIVEVGACNSTTRSFRLPFSLLPQTWATIGSMT